jgi:signal transduction histidine kinase
MLRLEVADDGSGFDHDVNRRQALEGKSVGLLSMAERVTLAGGEFEIVSSPGKGTRVRASFPLISGANAPNYLETSRDAHIVGR